MEHQQIMRPHDFIEFYDQYYNKIYERDGVVYLEKESKNPTVAQPENPVKFELFKRDDIPAEFLPGASSLRFSCLAYCCTYGEDRDRESDATASKEDNAVSSKGKEVNSKDDVGGVDGILIFTLQTFNDGQQNTGGKSTKPAVSLLSYSLKDKTFRFIDKISDPSGGITCSNLSLDTASRYIAIDLFLEGPEMKNYVLVYDINSGEKVDISNLLEIQDASPSNGKADIADLLEIQDTPSGIDSQDDVSIETHVSQSNSISFNPANLKSIFWSKKGLMFCARINQQSMNYIYKSGLKR